MRIQATLAAAALMAAACGKTTDRVDSTASTTATATDSAAGALSDSAMNRTSSGGWTPASTLGFATAANLHEIEEAKLASTKATNAQVKAFAKELLADHEAMLKDGADLAAKLNVAPDTANGDAHDAMEHARDELKDLNAKAAGADWDEDYLEKQIDGHQKVLDKLQDAAKNATDADLRTTLEKATGKVQQHLTKAQDLKAKLHK